MTKRELTALRGAIYAIAIEDRPVTVRQAFYRLVSQGAIDKTEQAYKRIVRLMVNMRLDRELPFSWVADSTRWMRKPTTFASLGDMLNEQCKFYRRSLWDNQEDHVEFWLEKEALAGVVMAATEDWDVPLMVTRGYSSISYLHVAAEAIRAKNKPTYLFYLGDFDPSGVDIPRNVEQRLREFSGGGVEIHFEVVAVTPELIERLNLPTRPTKKTDSRSKNFKGESVEVDAIPPKTLRRLVRDCIENHIDQGALAQLKLVERAERESLDDIMRSYAA